MRRRNATSIIGLWLAVFLPSYKIGVARAQTQSVSGQFEGLPVTRIVWEPETQPLAMSEIAATIPLRKDQPYRAANVRATIERLFATGRYRDIQVDATPAAGGVAVRFVTKISWFIGHVGVDSDLSEPPSPGQIISTSRLDLGVPFDESQVALAEENIRKLLINNGYFGPEVSHRFDYDSTYQQVAITFAIRAGKRAHYEMPRIAGDTSVVPPEAIDKATRWRKFLLPGYRGITQSRTRSGVDDIRAKYENANRLLATMTLDSIEPAAGGKAGLPHITVNPGAVVEIRADGAKVSRKTLRQNVPVFEEHTVDADLLAEGAANLRDYFQSRGYFDATVEYKQTRAGDGRTDIDYIVTPGTLHRFTHIEITGNKYFDTKTIRERLFLIPKSFEFRRGRYSEALRHRDENTIADLYESNGFRDAKVTSRVVDDYLGRKGDEAVFFAIEEGPQYRVANLFVNGAHRLDLTNTIASLSSQKGQVFSESNIAIDRETVIRGYGDNGFADATFEWDSKPGAVPHTEDVTFTIHEGPQQFVRQVVTTGLHTTRPSLVDRQLQINPGDPLSPSAMADTQRRLYDLGIFSQVDMAVQNPDGDESHRYVLYDLEEARRYSITTGFGAEFARIGGSNAIADLSDPGGAPGVTPRVSLDLTRLNVRGTGQSISFQSRLSSFQKRASISYFIPRIFSLPKFDATFSIVYDDTHDVRTFQSIRREGSAQIVQHVSKPVTFFYRFNYREVGVGNLKIDPLLLPLLAQSVRVGIATFNVVQDRRDDPTDPHKGIYNTLDVGLASKIFGSQTSFARILGRNATYYRLGEKIILARETQFGLQPAFSIPANSDPTDPIPLPERFFGGGGNTQRGFPENQAGPRDTFTGFPLGGSALFFNNTELRFPLYGANINGVLFEDAGNVYSSLSKLSFRTDQKDVADFNYMVHAAGFGIRYRTPVGPIRADLAYSINPPKYNGFPGSYVQLVQCSVSNSCQASIQQINHFQFFFSIGQAF
ncbi:MAG TPA: POTRA domain-containing protein [Bryobacteraceae bacterium]|nr:POTRA domain-containing protein [Bryobacteraceae bacterium]